MIPRIRSRISYSNVIASLALFIALGGAAVAAGHPEQQRRRQEIKNGAVTTKKLRKEAVTGLKIAAGSVTGSKLAGGSVTNSKIAPGAVGVSSLANGAVNASKLANNAVTNSKIANGVVGTNKLGNSVVTTVKLADKSVTAAKLSDEIGPIGRQPALRADPARRLRMGGELKATRASQTFQYPLANAPAFSGNLLEQGKTSTACSGTGNGGVNPQAAAGQLCVYITGSTGLLGLEFGEGSVSRLGFGLFASFTRRNPATRCAASGR